MICDEIKLDLEAIKVDHLLKKRIEYISNENVLNQNKITKIYNSLKNMDDEELLINGKLKKVEHDIKKYTDKYNEEKMKYETMYNNNKNNKKLLQLIQHNNIYQDQLNIKTQNNKDMDNEIKDILSQINSLKSKHSEMMKNIENSLVFYK